MDYNDNLKCEYYEDRGVYKNFCLDKIDANCVMVPLSLITSQYLEFVDDDEMALGNHVFWDEDVFCKNKKLGNIVENSSDRISFADFMNMGIAVVLLKRGEDGVFYESCTGEKIVSPLDSIPHYVLQRWDGLGNGTSECLKDEFDSFVRYPLVVGSKYVFDVSDKDAIEIENYCRRCCKDTLKKRFRKMKRDAFSNNMKVLNAVRDDIYNDNYSDYVYASFVKKKIIF